jgi:hypothetical protein
MKHTGATIHPDNRNTVMWLSKFITSGRENTAWGDGAILGSNSLRNRAAVLKSFDGSASRHMKLILIIWYTKLTSSGIYWSKYKRLGAGKYSGLCHCWLAERGLLYRGGTLSICIAFLSIMGTATVWQEMDEPRTQVARHRCAYRERLGFGAFTDRMPEKCVYETALHSRLFCAMSRWHSTVNENSICWSIQHTWEKRHG